MQAIVFIALGGAFGAVLRYGISGWVQNWTGSLFPWGTMAVNIIGCFTATFVLLDDRLLHHLITQRSNRYRHKSLLIP